MMTAGFAIVALVCFFIVMRKANEVTSSVSIAYDDDVTAKAKEIASRIETSTGKKVTDIIQTIGTSEEAIDLGDISSVGAYVLVNLDETNYIEIKVATGGAIRDKLKPDVDGDGKGGWCAGTCMGSGSQAPFAIANTAACKLGIFLIEQ